MTLTIFYSKNNVFNIYCLMIIYTKTDKNRHYIEITKKKIIIQESTKTMFKKK